MTAKKTTVAKKAVAKAVVPKRPVIKERYEGLDSYYLADGYPYKKCKVPTTKITTMERSATVRAKNLNKILVGAKEFAKKWGVSVDAVSVRHSSYDSVYLHLHSDETDEEFNKRVAATTKVNNALDAYRKDVRDQKAWDKKYAKPTRRAVNQGSQVLLQTVLSDPEIDAIIRRKYS